MALSSVIGDRSVETDRHRFEPGVQGLNGGHLGVVRLDQKLSGPIIDVLLQVGTGIKLGNLPVADEIQVDHMVEFHMAPRHESKSEWAGRDVPRRWHAQARQRKRR